MQAPMASMDGMQIPPHSISSADGGFASMTPTAGFSNGGLDGSTAVATVNAGMDGGYGMPPNAGTMGNSSGSMACGGMMQGQNGVNQLPGMADGGWNNQGNSAAMNNMAGCDGGWNSMPALTNGDSCGSGQGDAWGAAKGDGWGCAKGGGKCGKDSWDSGKGDGWGCGKDSCGKGKGEGWGCGKGDSWGCKGDGWGDGWGKGDAWGKGCGKKGDGGWGKGDGWGKGGNFMDSAWNYLNSAWDSWGGKGGCGGGGGGGDWIQKSAKVKIWNEDKGFGFVTTSTGEDVYVHRTNLTDCTSLVMGSDCYVEAQWNWERNKWQATKCSASGGGCGKGDGGKGDSGKDAGKGGKGKSKGSRGPDWIYGYSCTVKQWHEDKGFGFVSTAEGEDVYVHRTHMVDGSSLEPNAQVWVDAAWNWERNKWQASKLEGASGAPPVQAGIQKPVATGMQGGKVKTWNEKGYGFLVPDNGGPDVFVHQRALSNAQGLHEGQAVVFDLQLDEARGKYLAMSCQVLDAQPPAGTDASSFGPVPGGAPGQRSEPYDPSLLMGGMPPAPPPAPVQPTDVSSIGTAPQDTGGLM